MPIESYTVQIKGPRSYSYRDTPTSSPVTEEYQALVRHFGYSRTIPTKRPKPRGWRMPTAYQLSVVSAVYPHGIHTTRDVLYFDERQSVGALGPRPTGEVSNPSPQPAYQGDSSHGPLWFVTPNGNALKERAERQAYIKLKQQKVNLGVMAGEARKTAHHVTDSALRLANAAWAVKRRDFRAAMRHLGVERPRRAPGKWLEWRYGWMPLLSDIHGSAQALAESHVNPVGWQHAVKGVIREPWEQSGYGTTTGAARVFRKESGMTGAFVRFDVIPDNSFLATLGSLGLTNPLEIAWELLPLSFVIDWLVPVGDWLSTLDAAYGYNFQSGSFTIRGEGTGTAKSAPDDTKPVRCVPPSYGGIATCRKLTLARTVYNGFPTPQYPRLRLGLNLNRWADAMSLLTQAFK